MADRFRWKVKGEFDAPVDYDYIDVHFQPATLTRPGMDFDVLEIMTDRTSYRKPRQGPPTIIHDGFWKQRISEWIKNGKPIRHISWDYRDRVRKARVSATPRLETNASQRRRYLNVLHLRFAKKASPAWPTSVWGTCVPHGTVPITPNLTKLLALVPDVPPSAVSKAAKQFVSDCETDIPNDVSLANFLIELREGLSQYTSKVGKIIFNRISRLRSSSKPIVKFASKDVSSDYLGYQFGLKPAWSDLKKMAASWSRFRNRMRFLKQTQGKTMLLRRKYTIHPDDWVIPGPLFEPVAHHHQMSDDVVLKYEIVPGEMSLQEGTEAHVLLTGRFSNFLAGLDNFWNQMAGFGKILGLANPIAIGWEATPYSWLVDWSVDTKSIISQCEGTVFHGKLHLEPIGHSIKAFFRIRLVVLSDGEELPGTEAFLNLRVYQRKAGFPATESARFIRTDTLSKDSGYRASILLALLHQRANVPIRHNWDMALNSLSKLRRAGRK